MMEMTMIIRTTTLIIANNVSQVIAAEGENSAAQALRNASEVEQFFKTNAKSQICHKFLKLPQVISGSPAAMQLRYLQVRYFPFLPSFENVQASNLIISGLPFYKYLTDSERDLTREELYNNISCPSRSHILLQLKIVIDII